MKTRDWSLLAAGLVLAGFGLGAFLLGDEGEPVVSPATESAPVPAAVEAAPVPVPTSAPLEIDGIPGAVARVLGEHGSAGLVPASGVDLPDSVLRVLRERRVVLTLPGALRPAGVVPAAR